MESVRDCLKSGNHHKLYPSIDNGKWFAAKVLKESSDLQENGNLTLPPFIPLTGRRAFPSNTIPSLSNYGHVHYCALESILLNLDNTEDIQGELGHMTDKGMKTEESMWIRALCMIWWALLNTSSRVAVDENGATAQCYCCEFCEQWCCSLRLLSTLLGLIFAVMSNKSG